MKNTFTSTDLDKLETWLHAPDRAEKTLPLDMLQGMLCAVVSAPKAITPLKWLPLAMGGEEAMQAHDAKEVMDLLIAFQNDVARQLNANEEFDFILYGEGEEDSIDMWCDGYLLGVDLAEPSWDETASPEEMDEMLFPFIALSHRLNEEGDGETDANAPGPEEEKLLLERVRGTLVDQIMENRLYWFEKGIPQTVRREAAKIGRNDPCPCGSGKKHKNCCGSATLH